MKVISGKYRGRKLFSLEGVNTRPTSARVKEDMFNIINNWFIYDEKVGLDLFGGSGALGLELISRGLKFVFFNDNNKQAINIIQKNLFNVPNNQYEILNFDYIRALEYVKLKYPNGIDIIMLDPPFQKIEYYYTFFDKVINDKIISLDGLIVTESPNLLDTNKITNLVLLKYKNFKNKHMYIFRLEEEIKNGK